MASWTSTGTTLLAPIRSIAKGVPITVLAGMHVGCLELIVNDRVRMIPDLKGKRVGIDDITGNTTCC